MTRTGRNAVSVVASPYGGSAGSTLRDSGQVIHRKNEVILTGRRT
ncbi:MAG: hypothetical protein WD794_16960 [Mycobacteriales bacterium]